MPNLAELVKQKQTNKEKPKTGIKTLDPPKNLKPPKAPKLVVETKLDEIAFQEIANSTEFKRLVYLIWFGKTHRGKTQDLERQLVKRKQEITVIKEIERGSRKNFGEVVKELKQVLSERKKVVELTS